MDCLVLPCAAFDCLSCLELPWAALEKGCGTHIWAEKKTGNRQPHLANVEVTAHLKTLFLLSQEYYRPPSNNPPRDMEVTCSAHHRTYGSLLFVLCSLCFIVFCIATVRFDSSHCIVMGLMFSDVYVFTQRTDATNCVAFWSKTL